jgi:hypothetical protein
MNTDEMVKDRAWASFCTLGPSRITGAVQAIVTRSRSDGALQAQQA